MANKTPATTRFSFDASKVAPQQPLEPVPTDWYNAKIVESGLAPTKDTTGQLLNLTWEIVDGQFKGRRLWDRINVKNKSADAQRIGLSQLSAICHCTGVMQVNDSKELHNKIIQIRALYRDADANYDASNDIKGYKPAEGSVAATAGAAPAAAAAKWGKKAPVETPVEEPTPEPAPEEAGADSAGVQDYSAVGFYAYYDDASQEHTGAELLAMFQEGMPMDTPICLDTESDKGWLTVADFPGLLPPEEKDEPAAPTPPPAPVKKGPAAPKAAAAGPATPAKAKPPWLAKKK